MAEKIPVGVGHALVTEVVRQPVHAVLLSGLTGMRVSGGDHSGRLDQSGVGHRNANVPATTPAI